MSNPLTLDAAQRLMNALIAHACQDGGKPIAIAVVNAHGDLICAARMDGCKVPSSQTAYLKARTAAQYSCDTIELRRGKGAYSDIDVANAMRVNPTFVSWAGGALIEEGGNIVGAVGVSNRTEEEDHELARRRDMDTSIS